MSHEKNENKQKRGRVWPTFLKTIDIRLALNLNATILSIVNVNDVGGGNADLSKPLKKPKLITLFTKGSRVLASSSRY